MADEEVMGSVSPAPSDHKRKLEDLDSDPFDQPPITTGSNGNSESVADVDGDADVKRPRIDDKPDSVEEAAENGHQEERTEEPKEAIAESPAVVKNTELEEDQDHEKEVDQDHEKVVHQDHEKEEQDHEKEEEQDHEKEEEQDHEKEEEKDQERADEPLDAINKESVTDDAHANAIELQSAENPEESVKEEHQETGVEHQDPTSDGASQGDVDGLKEHPTSADQPTSRRMEVPSNKVGVLIGKAGDTIRTLQYSSGARIQITRDADADPNSATRSVELIGSLENINKAERLIKEVIAEADAGGSPSLVARGFTVNSSGVGEQIQIQVPNEKVGLIIGKGGENIKNLQTRSGARIQLIPQHLPEGDQSKERTVRVTGDRKQIEAAKEMIKEVMEQPVRSSTPSSGNNHNQQPFRPRGGPGPHWGGPRGHHPSQPTGYNNYPQRGGYQSQNPPYPSSGYGNYPPQQPPPKNNFGWDQRPPPNMQGPPEQTGYDYYGGPGGHMGAPPPAQPPMHSHAPPPSYNYGQPQGPDYGQQQQPPPYQQAPPPQGYSNHGYGEPKYDNQGPPQNPYSGQGAAQPQPSTYPQPTAHYDQYGKPLAYNTPPPGPYGQPYGQPRQQPYPYSSAPMQQGSYSQYGTAPAGNEGYGGQSGAAAGGYPYPQQQGGQPVSGYGQTGGQQSGPTTGYGQAGPTSGYGQYPSTQGGYTEQAAPNSGGYGYGPPPVADPAYGGGPGGASYGAPPAVQPAYSQQGPGPGPVPVQAGYEQSVPQSGGYVTPQPQAQPGYGQYDGSQMYGGHR